MSQAHGIAGTSRISTDIRMCPSIRFTIRTGMIRFVAAVGATADQVST